VDNHEFPGKKAQKNSPDLTAEVKDIFDFLLAKKTEPRKRKCPWIGWVAFRNTVTGMPHLSSRKSLQNGGIDVSDWV
jgi:hypothetical protein